MIEVFNAATVPWAQFWPLAVSIGVLVGCVIWKRSGRRVPFFFPFVFSIYGVMAGAIPTWDQFRLRAKIASGEGMEVTRGRITDKWRIVEERRDARTSNMTTYTTVVTEGFDVSGTQFDWVKGQCLSRSSLCDMSHTTIPLAKGMEVEVTWFEDPAEVGARRILKLLISRRSLSDPP